MENLKKGPLSTPTIMKRSFCLKFISHGRISGAYPGGRTPGGPVSHKFWRPGAKLKNVALTPTPPPSSTRGAVGTGGV